ncbi:hypothetical protein Ade02nite_00930 [Paractinoplanes deccanensis]|uniref:HEAT repeat domain-containing protein n=1 Tax=Paractinoplanes deccanensis TaxID=113561 RepID=A0ABQ3XUW7_9ACTN|nr:hypothetical protein [Actinoplanes deccanensis]GID71452.1 hypothetical protein Ade02nite_00930 [Actinoplanes deccanensis]
MIETADEFVRLVTSEDPAQRRRAAWEDALDEVWTSLVANYPDMHFWVANNRTISEGVMRSLAADDDWRVRDRIAMKNSCPTDILDLLSWDPHDAVAAAVAGHPNTSDEALRRLAKHPWEKVREKALLRLKERSDRSG